MQLNIGVEALCARSKGVSLVDMVVVVTLAGMFTAFAIPRFTHVKNVVRASEVAALGVNLRSAAMAAHSQYMASGSKASSATLKGRVVHLQNGYPDVGGMRLALGDSPDFVVKASPNAVTYFKIGAPSAAQCAVTYHPAQADLSDSTMTDVSTSGC